MRVKHVYIGNIGRSVSTLLLRGKMGLNAPQCNSEFIIIKSGSHLDMIWSYPLFSVHIQ